jgi:omega-6 fatty acid desaturase (delta-12 desaturase)
MSTSVVRSVDRTWDSGASDVDFARTERHGQAAPFMSSTLSLSDAVSGPVLDPAALDIQALPTRAQVRAAIPVECFRFDPVRAFAALAVSLLAVAVPTALAALYLPMTWAWAPVWVLHAAVVGTAATGVWVIAHECGHGAFSRNGRLQDAVGFVLHSALLVPYFSWQRSHAVHHRFTNHLTDGETHVPKRAEQRSGRASARLRERLGPDAFAVVTIAKALLAGWPAYLLAGVSGSPARGRSNHFWPTRPFATELFPGRWHARVWASSAAVVGVLAALVAWSIAVGSTRPGTRGVRSCRRGDRRSVSPGRRRRPGGCGRARTERRRDRQPTA